LTANNEGQADLGALRYMYSEVRLSRNVGRIDGTTDIWTYNPLFGFHGAVAVRFLDQNGDVIGITTGDHIWGVDGWAIFPLTSHRSDQMWSEPVDLRIAQNTTQLELVHMTETRQNFRDWLIREKDAICEYWKRVPLVGSLPCPIGPIFDY
jgi:hypothetical protein